MASKCNVSAIRAEPGPTGDSRRAPAGDPEVGRLWKSATISDDPVNMSNVRGTVVFAKSSLPGSATTQLFINLTDNHQLDGMGFAPIGQVVESMDVVDPIY